ncbi:MAG: Transcriptional activator protein vanR [Panacagrimonas sp.]|nr:Transcriptional activator protein vanR [Panacagrimonas sp.]
MPTRDTRPGSMERAKNGAEPARTLYIRQEFVEPWVRRCEAFANAENLRYFVFGLIVPRPEGRSLQFVLTNYPHDWLRMYDHFGYIRLDPVAAKILTSIKPFAWDELPVVGNRLKTFWNRAARFGLRHGYTIPIHGPRGQHAAFVLSGTDVPLAQECRQQRFERAWSFTNALVDEVFGTYLQQDASIVKPLIPKQRQALSLIARGYSIREIGKALGLHSRTVEYHLRGALERLGATTREQGIVRALLNGDIEELSYPGRLRDWCLRFGTD